MNIIVGAGGRVGSALVKELNKRKMPVTAVIRNKDKAGMFNNDTQVRIADVFDADSLIKAFEGGKTVFLITPESMHSEDVLGDAEKVIENYHKAIEKAGVRRIVGLSSIGTHIGEGSGNLFISHKLEKAFAGLPVQTTFIRPAYFYSNWLGYIDVAREHGILPTFFNPEQKLTMISPADVAQFAAIVMRSEALSAPFYEVAGPVIYNSIDVAQIFGKFLNRDVFTQQVPQEQWTSTLVNVGFSTDAAHNMALMTEAVVNGSAFAENPGNLIVWNTDMNEYLAKL